MSFFSSTWINGASMPQVVLRSGDIPPPLNERYFTQLDGQSKYWRRIEPDYGQTTTATIECLFVGGSGSGFQLVTGRHSNDRFYIGINNGSSAVFGNGAATSGSTPVDRTKINHAKLTADGTNVTFYVNGVQISQVAQTWSGLLDQVGFGAKDSGTSNFYDGILVSARVTTDTVDNVYGLDKNLPYELPDGVELGPELPAATRDFSSGGPWDNGTFTRSNTIGVWSTDAGGIGPRTDADSLLSSDFWLISWSDLVDSDIYINLDGALSLVSAASSGTQVVGIGSATTTAQLYLRASSAGTKTLSAFSLRSIPNSALIFENGSIDGSDRLLVTENQDGTGFLGETGIKYDYAAGAAPMPSQRYFTQLDGQSKYWRRVEPDYGQTTTATIECSFFGKSGSGFEYLIGRNSNDRFYIGLNSSGDVGYAKGGSNFAGQTTVDLTKINHAKLVADGTDVKFYVNSVLIATQAQGWSGLLDEVGFGVKGDQLLDFYSGILLSARVITDTVDNVYGLDTNLAYDLPDGVELGPELWVNPASEIESGWAYNGNGSYTRSAAGNDSAISNNIVFVSGQAVNITLTIDSIDVGGFKVSAQGGASVNVPSTSGVHTVQCIAGASGTTKVSGTTASTRGSVSGVSIKVASALMFENGSADGSDRFLVIKNQDGTGFDGEEFWADSVKAVSGNATAPTPNSIAINEIGTTLAAIGIDAPTTPITVSGVAAINSGQVDISVAPNFAGVAASITSSGPFSFDLDSQGAVNFKRAFNGGAVAEITDIKVKARYDYATGANT